MTEAAGSSLSAVDYVVIVAVLLVSASIGVYFRLSGGRQKTTKVGCPYAKYCFVKDLCALATVKVSKTHFKLALISLENSQKFLITNYLNLF